jgi:pilus assembly protein CpaB
MKTPSILMLAGALVVAGGAALLARALLATPPAPVVVQVAPPVEVAPPKQAILVTSRDLKPGEFLDYSAVQWLEVDTQHSPLLYFLRDQDSVDLVLGATVRQPIAQGQPLLNNLVVHAGEPGFVAAVLKPGMRAIAVPTNAVASNSGLVSAGDRVDVILSLNRSQEENRGGVASGSLPPVASQTLLRDVRVLALNNVARSDLRLRESAADQAAKKKQRRDNEFYETVTLEVPPQQAERLAVAREIGTLQLVLRGLAEPSSGHPLDGNRQATTLHDATSIYNSLGRPVHTYQGKDVQVVKVKQ